MALTNALKKLLGKELAAQVEEKIGESDVAIVEENMIPQSDFDKRLKGVQKKSDEFEKQSIKLAGELKTLSESTEDVTELKKSIVKLNKEHETALGVMVKENATIKLNSKVDAKLTVAKIKSDNARKGVKALIDMEKVSLDGDNLLGFDEQLAAIQKSDAYFFDTQQSSGGTPPGQGAGGPPAPGERKYQKELDEARKNRNSRLATKIILEAHEAKINVF